MKLSTKAALFSGLIYPGAGFFLLKKPWLGIIFLTPATIALIYIFNYSMQIAREIADQIVAGHIALNAPAISTAISAALTGNAAFMLSLAKLGFMLIWLVSIALCYWMGKRAEQSLSPVPPRTL